MKIYVEQSNREGVAKEIFKDAEKNKRIILTPTFNKARELSKKAVDDAYIIPTPLNVNNEDFSLNENQEVIIYDVIGILAQLLHIPKENITLGILFHNEGDPICIESTWN